MSENQEENTYDEYEYEDQSQQGQVTPTGIGRTSRSFLEPDPTLSIGLHHPSSQHAFEIDPSSRFLPSSNPQVSSLGEAYLEPGPAPWNFNIGTGSPDYVIPHASGSAPDSVVTSPTNFPSDEFGIAQGDPSWPMANTPGQNWESFAQLDLGSERSTAYTGFPPHPETMPSPMGVQQPDPFSMSAISPSGDSIGSGSPVYSHGVAAPPEATRPRTAIRQPKHSSTSGDTSLPYTSHHSGRLRSAAQSSRPSIHKPGETDQDRAARASHNVVERNYRTRLNAEYEKLLAVVPVPPDDKKISKHEVLELARERIQDLEAECALMKRENNELKIRTGELTTPYQGSGESWEEGGGMGITGHPSQNPP